jgi:hypothetical protein
MLRDPSKTYLYDKEKYEKSVYHSQSTTGSQWYLGNKNIYRDGSPNDLHEGKSETHELDDHRMYLANVCTHDGSLCHEPKPIIEPPW